MRIMGNEPGAMVIYNEKEFTSESVFFVNFCGSAKDYEGLCDFILIDDIIERPSKDDLEWLENIKVIENTETGKYKVKKDVMLEYLTDYLSDAIPAIIFCETFDCDKLKLLVDELPDYIEFSHH